MALTVTLTFDKDTKNTVRFEETSVAEGRPPAVIGTLYVQKWAWNQLGQPRMVTVTVDATADGSPDPV